MIEALKQEVLDSADRTLWILKVMKLFYGSLDPSNFANKDSYLYFILAPILKPLLLQDTRNRFVFGESNLKAKAVEINRYLDDDERGFAGPKIDAILIDKKYNMEIMTIEVSGPPNKINHTHFLEDRNKTAKNLKAMFKHIVSKLEDPSIISVRKLKLRGIQFYNNQAYIYSLSRPCDSYVFSLDMVFPVLGQSSILHQSIPTFVKQFSAIPWLIHETHAILDDIFTFDKSQEILEEVNDDPSPHVSPRKKQKAKNSEE
ncbi:hypothetical protein [Parasitella parasitica]|uniref:Uncharacterized protein n=1 Tax=Parasitella parasitica TaxID=35722 RepID=A0A0B7NRF4_9FUNG|nr:hypothetical protein [Parasitella parasitica]